MFYLSVNLHAYHFLKDYLIYVKLIPQRYHMPTKTYYLDEKRTESIEIKWGFNWRNLRVIYLGEIMGTIANKTDLTKGQTFKLSGLRDLSIQLKGDLNPELELLLNGKTVPGSPTDPRFQLNKVFRISIGLAVLNISFGLLSWILDISLFTNFGIGLSSVFFGAIILVLSFGLRAESKLALSAIVSLLVADIISTFYYFAGTDVVHGPAITIKVVVFFLLIKGFSAIRELNETKRKQPKME